MAKFLSEEFLAKYPELPEHMNALGRFVYYRTYSRYLPEMGRRETWRETCIRAVNYNIELSEKHYKKIGYAVPYEDLKAEAEDLFDNMFNLRQFLSGRTLWVGGAESGVAENFPLANFNCSYASIRSFEDICDIFYLLMLGTGTGFKVTKEFAKSLPPVRDRVKVIHSPYEPLPKNERLEHTKLVDLKNGYVKIYIGDSKEGWVDALRQYFKVLTDTKYMHVHTIKFSYNSVRPHGERLLTFGGTASGPQPLQEMFDGIAKVIRNEMDKTLAPPVRYDKMFVKLRPIHIVDFCNLIGNNVVVGGVRRTAEIALFDADDYECIFAKYGINGVWDEAKHLNVIAKAEAVGIDTTWLRELPLNDANARPLHHRRMSNNSIAFEKQPTKAFLDLVFAVMQAEGEPGFVNLEAAGKRRPNMQGLNPCAEILLDSYGVCNLTTVNLMQFVVPDPYNEGKLTIDFDALQKAQALSARAGLRMTLTELELPHWNAVQQRDRLLGCSLTGWKDAMELVGATPDMEADLLHTLKQIAEFAAENYAHALRVNAPLLITTVKPEGTLSQVAGGVSSGLHYSHSEYYIRRIRINSADPLAKLVQTLGWTVNPEVGTVGDTEEERLDNAKTWVIDFPVKSGSKIQKDDIPAVKQLANYFAFQQHYTHHNSSNTITVKPNEWNEVCDAVYNNWDEFVAVSFLANDGGSYQLAPYEEIDEAKYNELVAGMMEFKPEFLEAFETGEEGDVGDDGCESGVCPVR